MLRSVLLVVIVTLLALEALGTRLLKEARVGWAAEAPAPLNHLWLSVNTAMDDRRGLGTGVRPARDVLDFARDQCVELPAGSLRQTEPTEFDIAMFEFLVHRVIDPVERFTATLMEACQMTLGRSPAEVTVADHCATPEILVAVEKTFGAYRHLELANKKIVAWAAAKDLPVPVPPPSAVLSRGDRVAGGGGGGGQHPGDREPQRDLEDRKPQQARPRKRIARPRGGLRMATPRRFEGWKKLLVALLIGSPEAKFLWPQYKGELLQHVCDGNMDLVILKDTPPKLLAEPEWIMEHFSEYEMEVLYQLMGKRKLASSPSQQPDAATEVAAEGLEISEDLADATLAATHLTEVCQHSSFAHRLLADSTIPQELRQALQTARAIVTKDFKLTHMLGGAQLLASELVAHGFTSLTVLKDLVLFATLSEDLSGALASLKGFAEAQASMSKLGVLVDVIDDADMFELFDGELAEHLAMDEATACTSMVKGSDAAVRLSSALEQFPNDLCQVFQNYFHEVSVHASQAAVFLHNFHL